MRRLLSILFISALLGLFCASAPADTVILKNGKEIKGRILKEDENEVNILTPAISLTIPRMQIAEIKKDADRSRQELLGDMAFDDENYSEALSYYREALKSGKNTEGLEEKIRRIENIRTEEVKRRFGQRLNQADRLAELKQFDRAEELLKEILEDLPSEDLARPVNDKMSELYYKKALEYRNTVDDLKAVESLKKSIELSEDSYRAHLMYADYLMRSSRDHEDAIDHYRRGLKAGKNELSQDELAKYHRKVALLFEEKNRHLMAIEHHEKVLDYDPIAYPDTAGRIVDAYLQLAMETPPVDFSRRKAYLEAAREADPYSAKARFAMALIYYENNRINDAVEECKKLIEMNSRLPDVNYYLAMCYLRMDEYEKARRALERELEINPRSYDATCAMGDYLLEGGNYEEAIENYETARELRPEKYRAYIGLAKALRKIEKPEEARENLERVFVTNPDHIEATLLSGALYKDEEEYKKARELFDSVVTRLKETANLNNPDVRNLMVEALNQRGELNLILESNRIAIADFNESLKYAPDRAETFYNIAQANIKLSKFREAEKFYFKAIDQEPKNPRFYQGLGLLYHNYLKKKELAIENYEKYIRLGGEDFPTVNEWIRELGGKPVEPPTIQ